MEFTREQLMTALRAAHDAGDTAGAQQIAQMIQSGGGAAANPPAEIEEAPQSAASLGAGGGAAPPSTPPMPAMEVLAQNGDHSIVQTDRGRFLVNAQGQWQPIEVDGDDGGGFLERAISRNPDDLARAADLSQRAERQSLGVDDGALTGFSTQVLRGIPFAGSFVDEGLGKLFGAFGGDEEARTQQARDIQETFAIANPKTSIGANVGGALLTAPVAVANAPRVLGSGSLLSKVGRGIGFGAALGAAEGAVYGAGDGVEGSRADSAQSGALFGAAFGGGIGGLVPAVGSLGRTLFNAAAGRKARQAARELGMDQDVAGLVADRVRADSASAASNIAQSGESATLGNLGPSTRGLLDAVANAPGESAAIARDGVNSIVEGATTRFTQTLDDVLGAPQGPRSTMREIMQESATPRREAYEAAFASPIDYASDAGRNIEAAMRRVDPADLQAAVREANAQMRDLGVSNQQMRATISDAGEVSFETMPDVRQLNALKIGLDTVAENSKNALGIMSPQGVRAASQARALRDALGEAVPQYREALRLGGDAIAERNAVELGRSMLRPQFTREQMAEALEGLGETELGRVRQGLRSQIDDAMANVRRGLTRSDSDPQSVLAPLRQLTAPAAREKAASILGPDEATRLFSMLDEAEQAFSMRISTGSQTAPRLQTESALRELVPNGLSDQIVEGGLMGPVRTAAARVAQAGGQTQEQALDELRSYLARTLTQTGDIAPRVQQLNEFADLGQRTQKGRVVAERTGQQLAAGTVPAIAAGTSRPEVDNSEAIYRRLSELGFESSQIDTIMQGGPEAIAQALTVMGVQ